MDRVQSKRNYSRLFAICNTQGFDYKDKVAEYTRNYCPEEHDSLRALTDEQYDGLMILLIEINKGFRGDFVPKAGDKQRKKLIGMAKTMFWGKDTEETVKELDKWCRKQKYKKGLMSHNPAELDLLLAIFEQKVYPDYFKNLNR